MIRLSPSILSADFSKLGEQIRTLDSCDIDFIHIDVMDGNFVPNISLGFPVIKSIRKYTKKTFDVHLMIEDPSRYIEELVKCGADIITIHYETDRHIDRTLNYIKSFGVKAAVALNPGTPVMCIKNVLSIADMVVIMAVNPGYGGQNFIDYSLDKIKEVKEMSKSVNKDILIEVDGGITADNIKKIVEAGANVIVAGSAVFKDNKIKANIDLLKGSIV